jgi:hypothetical protein
MLAWCWLHSSQRCLHLVTLLWKAADEASGEQFRLSLAHSLEVSPAWPPGTLQAAQREHLSGEQQVLVTLAPAAGGSGGSLVWAGGGSSLLLYLGPQAPLHSPGHLLPTGLLQ